MKLFYSPTSPFVRKVLVLLNETGQLSDVTLHESSTSPLDPVEGLAAANPIGKIPALERPDGCTLYDSRVITQYLDARAGGKLYPEGTRRWEVLTLEATGDGIAEAALLMTYEARLRPETARFDDFAEAQWTKISQACAALNARWMAHLHGPLDAGQISVACALAYVDFRHGARNWRAGNDALAAWYASFAERDSMTSTTPPS